MAAPVESSSTGEGMTDSSSMSIRVWMIENNIKLMDDTYSKLENNGFNTIEDLSAVTVEEMTEYLTEMKIKLADKSKLKRTAEILGNKARIHDPDEIKAVQSISLKIKEFEHTINNETNKQQNIINRAKNIEIEINDTFDKMIKKINERRAHLSKTVNDIKNRKMTSIKSLIDEYNKTLKNIKNIKRDNDLLMNKAIEIEELNDRKIKIIQSEQSVTKIIENAMKNNPVISDNIYATLDTTEITVITQIIETFGVISHGIGTVPVLEKLEYDNHNANGFINVFWKLHPTEHGNKDNCMKLSIEYGDADRKDQDMDEGLTIKQIDIRERKGQHKVQIHNSGVYSFKLKYVDDNSRTWSSYSNIETIHVQKIAPVPSIDSNILSDEEKEKLLQFMKQRNHNNNNTKFQFDLLYRYSRDDKTVKRFHELCDDKGQSVVFIVQSATYNHVFGFYSSMPWSSSAGWITDPNAFLFLLRSSFGHNAGIFPLKANGSYAAFHNGDYGVWVGNNAISMDDSGSYSNIRSKYFDVIKGNGLCGGETYAYEQSEKQYPFSIENYEVFSLNVS